MLIQVKCEKIYFIVISIRIKKLNIEEIYVEEYVKEEHYYT